MKMALTSLQQDIGYRFSKQSWLQEAMKTASPTVTHNEANNRLAMVGDALLRLLVMDAWYPSGNDIAAGQQQFNRVGTNKALAKLGQDHDIPECAATTPGKGQIATTVEALLGAVWYDSDKDLSKVKHVMDSLRDSA